MMIKTRNQCGFNLVEMAIVLVIVGLILGGILQGGSLVDGSRVKDAIATTQDMVAAAQSFRERYNFWPGDMPNPGSSMTGLPAACVAGGNANGIINAGAESTCAIEVLLASGLIKASDGPTAGTHVVRSTFGPVSFAPRVGYTGIAGLPVGWVNLLQMTNLNCRAATDMDRSLDDGNLTTGHFRGSISCVGASDTTSVPFAVYQVN